MSNRQNVYYWKCDRQSALQSFHKIGVNNREFDFESSVNTLLTKIFGANSYLYRPADSQGNHINYIVESAGNNFFLRIENGSEGDKYMEVEAKVLDLVRSVGVPTPKVYAVDASRQNFPFSYQLIEHINAKDLNVLWKNGKVNLPSLGLLIGCYLAKWQQIQPPGFGLFNQQILSQENALIGLHQTYKDYFFLNWDKHLDYLLTSEFINENDYQEIYILVKENSWCLQIETGVLVHKDLALWNILGTERKVKSFIDWDDVISGDPTDDISLLACYHSGQFINSVLVGYQRVKELPENFLIRFWLHLLRNMLVKAVIRIRYGYFNRDQTFFLIGKGESGEALKNFTKGRIKLACEGLKGKANITDL